MKAESGVVWRRFYPSRPPLSEGEEFFSLVSSTILSLNLRRDVERSDDREGKNLGQVSHSFPDGQNDVNYGVPYGRAIRSHACRP